MRVKELAVNHKELLILLSVLGGGIGVVQVAKLAGYNGQPSSAYAQQTPRSDTLAELASDVSQLKRDVSTLRSDVQAMLRAQCVTNPTRWEVYETAGIRCGDMIPSATQAGRVRRP